MLYFEGIDNFGNVVHHDIPDFWDIKGNYEIGDSIIKMKGEKNVRIVKIDKEIILRLGGHDGSLTPKN